MENKCVQLEFFGMKKLTQIETIQSSAVGVEGDNEYKITTFQHEQTYLRSRIDVNATMSLTGYGAANCVCYTNQ